VVFMREIRHAYGFSVGKPEGKRLLGRHRVEDNIIVGGCGLDSSGSRYGPFVDSLVEYNDTWVPKICEEY